MSSTMQDSRSEDRPMTRSAEGILAIGAIVAGGLSLTIGAGAFWRSRAHLAMVVSLAALCVLTSSSVGMAAGGSVPY